jgi:hypothetical protein
LWQKAMNGNGNTNTADKIASGSNGNEILRALLLFEQLPNHPTIAKLTSLSQVGYSLGVPIFLASKLALKGVNKFFQNVCKPSTRSSNSQTKKQ